LGTFNELQAYIGERDRRTDRQTDKQTKGQSKCSMRNVAAGVPKFGKVWASPSLELCVFRHLWSRSDAPCSCILYGYSHLPLAKIWESLGVPSSPIKSRKKSPVLEGTPLELDLRLPQGKIGIILRCNFWAVGWSPEGTF